MGVLLEQKKVVSIIGVDGNGKTLTTKRLLNSKEDLPLEEIENSKGYTLFSKIYYKNLDDKDMYLIDTPGSLSYISEITRSSYVSNASIYVLNSTTGASEQGLRFWWKLYDYMVPTVIYVNMMDDEKADFDSALESVKNTFKVSPLPIGIPVGKGKDFKGVINLIEEKFYSYKDDSGKAKVEDIPEEHKSLVEKYRPQMIEAIVETDEKLMERYFAGEEIKDSELREVLSRSVKTRQAYPVFAGSAEQNIGIDLLRNAIFYYSPSVKEYMPLKLKDGEKIKANEEDPFLAYVFKTKIDNYTGKINYLKILSGKINKSTKLSVSNDNNKNLKISKIYLPDLNGLKTVEEAIVGDIVALDKCDDLETEDTVCDSSRNDIVTGTEEPKRVLSYALDVEDKKLEEKVVSALKKLIEEDPSLKYERVPETKELVVSGLGQLQFDVLSEILKNKYKLDVKFRTPRIQYRETISSTVQVQGRHKKQSGGHGQFGDTWIKAEPLPRNGGFEFVDAIVGGAIPRNFIPSVEKGIKNTMVKGSIAGFPVIDVKVTLYDGSYHSVDSSDMAFQIAGSMAFKKAMEEANAILLEPIMNVKINVPENFVGTITNDLSGRRGRIQGMDSSPRGSVVKAQVPLSELSTYAPELHSMTKGLGLFEMDFSAYEPVPNQNVPKIVEETKKWQEEAK
jgi:elongation factor G